MSDLGSIRQGMTGQRVNVTLEAMLETEKSEILQMDVIQESSKLSLLEAEKEIVNPFAPFRIQKPIKGRTTKLRKTQQSGEVRERIEEIKNLKDTADQFQKRNPEFQSTTLTLLRKSIKPGDTKDEILRKLLDFYPDVSLADEVLEFLLATTKGSLAEEVQAAKDDLVKNYEREIVAGRKISVQAREAASNGLGSPTSLRDMYRDITINPRDSKTLFQELAAKYDYKQMKSMVDFFLHYLGADLKSKGPLIEKGELARLVTETRSLQAIVGVYRFFKNRMKLVKDLFAKRGLPIPIQLNFESMSQQFMNLAGSVPNSQEILQTASRMGIDNSVAAKIITFSQFRDAVYEVSWIQIFKNTNNRDAVKKSIIETLEELEDEIEELEEKAN